MRRLLLVAAVLAAIVVVTGCSGKTMQSTNVGPFTATMQASVQCNKGDTGYYYWRYRQVDPADETNDAANTGTGYDTLHPWVNLPHQDFGSTCKNGAVGPVTIQQPLGGIPGAVIGQTVYQLRSGTHYAYQLCGVWQGVTPPYTETCLDTDGGGHNANEDDGSFQYGTARLVSSDSDPYVGGQWGQIDTPRAVLPSSGLMCTGCVWGPGKAQMTDANGTVYAQAMTRPPVFYNGQPILNEDGTTYDPATDPAQQWNDSYQGTTTGGGTVQCTGGLACEAGNAPTNKTGWRCQDPPDDWGTWSQAGIKVWKASMYAFRMCVGIGGNRGKFNPEGVYFSGDVSHPGNLLGWKLDGGQPVYAFGPTKVNGQLLWTRALTFRQCWPPPWKNPLLGCTSTLNRIAVILKHWIWSNAKGVIKNANVIKFRCITCDNQTFPFPQYNGTDGP